MNKDDLKRCKAFLDYFNINYSGDKIMLNSGGNSIIMNPNTEWKDFLGHSINGVAEAVAEEIGIKTEWEDERY